MNSEALSRAREYEAREGARISPDERPLFHVTPPVGWLNDPNGFSVYRGEYHLFYQYHPYASKWGPMHWGHCKSRDLLHWERLPAALAPDTDCDRNGCFSGSAAELPDGRQALLYTGVREMPRGDGTVESFQAQCVAFGDGVDYEKCPANPVIGAAQLPDGGSAHDFRDPKLWREGDAWYAAVANRTADGSGAILLYRSDDLSRWRYEGELDRSCGELGRMWECPDFFRLDGRDVLLVSPQEFRAGSPAFRDGYESLCLIGERRGGVFDRQSVQSIDQGLDFYAPQTLLAPDGRRIMIGWLQDWAAAERRTDFSRPWFGLLSLPRELRVRDGRLFQTPVRELERCRANRAARLNLPVSAQTVLPGISGRAIDLTVRLRPVSDAPFRFTLHFAQDSRYRASLTFDSARRTLTLDRTRAGFPDGIVNRREVPVLHRGAQSLRLILDRFSAEIFLNDGEQTLSSALYTPAEADGVSFEADGPVAADIEKYDLI